MVQLRNYQQLAIKQTWDAVRDGYKKIVLCMPTGAGKTTTAGSMISQCLRGGKKVLTLVHVDELITQFGKRTEDQFGILSGIIKAGVRPMPQRNFQIGSIQTIGRRKVYPGADIVFIDEGHRSKGATYEKAMSMYPDAIIIALTATPFRGDKKPLGELFEKLVHPVRIMDLINLGKLVPTENSIFLPKSDKRVDLSNLRTRLGDFHSGDMYERYNDASLYKGVTENYLLNGNNGQFICFNVNIEHSKQTKIAFDDIGICTEHLDGKELKSKRRVYYRAFENGEIKGLHNVNLFVEGVDVPNISCIILNRAIKSLGFYVQAVGRGLRPFPGKTSCTVLDHGENTYRFNPVEYYDEMGFDINKTEKDITEEQEKKMRECWECHEMMPMRAYKCPHCDFVYTESKEAQLTMSEAQEFEKYKHDAHLFKRLLEWDYHELKKLPLKYSRLYGILHENHYKWAYRHALRNNLLVGVNEYDDDSIAYKKFRTQATLAENQANLDGKITLAKEWIKDHKEANKKPESLKLF